MPGVHESAWIWEEFVRLTLRKTYLIWAGRRTGGTGDGGRPPRSSSHLLPELLSGAWSQSRRRKKGEGREGREGRGGNQDDGTGVEFAHPAARARYWRDESLVLLLKSGGGALVVTYNLDEGKCDFFFTVLFRNSLKMRWLKLLVPKHLREIMWMTRICNYIGEVRNAGRSGRDYLML